ncbi:unnamed protein product, partial [Mesorhabditis spiculigera]
MNEDAAASSSSSGLSEASFQQSGARASKATIDVRTVASRSDAPDSLLSDDEDERVDGECQSCKYQQMNLRNLMGSLKAFQTQAARHTVFEQENQKLRQINSENSTQIREFVADRRKYEDEISTLTLNVQQLNSVAHLAAANQWRAKYDMSQETLEIANRQRQECEENLRESLEMAKKWRDMFEKCRKKVDGSKMDAENKKVRLDFLMEEIPDLFWAVDYLLENYGDRAEVSRRLSKYRDSELRFMLLGRRVEPPAYRINSLDELIVGPSTSKACQGNVVLGDLELSDSENEDQVDDSATPAPTTPSSLSPERRPRRIAHAQNHPKPSTSNISSESMESKPTLWKPSGRPEPAKPSPKKSTLSTDLQLSDSEDEQGTSAPTTSVSTRKNIAAPNVSKANTRTSYRETPSRGRTDGKWRARGLNPSGVSLPSKAFNVGPSNRTSIASADAAPIQHFTFRTPIPTDAMPVAVRPSIAVEPAGDGDKGSASIHGRKTLTVREQQQKMGSVSERVKSLRDEMESKPQTVKPTPAPLAKPNVVAERAAAELPEEGRRSARPQKRVVPPNNDVLDDPSGPMDPALEPVEEPASSEPPEDDMGLLIQDDPIKKRVAHVRTEPVQTMTTPHSTEQIAQEAWKALDEATIPPPCKPSAEVPKTTAASSKTPSTSVVKQTLVIDLPADRRHMPETAIKKPAQTRVASHSTKQSVQAAPTDASTSSTAKEENVVVVKPMPSDSASGEQVEYFAPPSPIMPTPIAPEKPPRSVAVAPSHPMPDAKDFTQPKPSTALPKPHVLTEPTKPSPKKSTLSTDLQLSESDEEEDTPAATSSEPAKKTVLSQEIPVTKPNPSQSKAPSRARSLNPSAGALPARSCSTRASNRASVENVDTAPIRQFTIRNPAPTDAVPVATRPSIAAETPLEADKGSASIHGHKTLTIREQQQKMGSVSERVKSLRDEMARKSQIIVKAAPVTRAQSDAMGERAAAELPEEGRRSARPQKRVAASHNHPNGSVAPSLELPTTSASSEPPEDDEGLLIQDDPIKKRVAHVRTEPVQAMSAAHSKEQSVQETLDNATIPLPSEPSAEVPKITAASSKTPSSNVAKKASGDRPHKAQPAIKEAEAPAERPSRGRTRQNIGSETPTPSTTPVTRSSDSDDETALQIDETEGQESPSATSPSTPEPPASPKPSTLQASAKAPAVVKSTALPKARPRATPARAKSVSARPTTTAKPMVVPNPKLLRLASLKGTRSRPPKEEKKQPIKAPPKVPIGKVSPAVALPVIAALPTDQKRGTKRTQLLDSVPDIVPVNKKLKSSGGGLRSQVDEYFREILRGKTIEDASRKLDVELDEVVGKLDASEVANIATKAFEIYDVGNLWRVVDAALSRGLEYQQVPIRAGAEINLIQGLHQLDNDGALFDCVYRTLFSLLVQQVEPTTAQLCKVVRTIFLLLQLSQEMTPEVKLERGQKVLDFLIAERDPKSIFEALCFVRLNEAAELLLAILKDDQWNGRKNIRVLLPEQVSKPVTILSAKIPDFDWSPMPPAELQGLWDSELRAFYQLNVTEVDVVQGKLVGSPELSLVVKSLVSRFSYRNPVNIDRIRIFNGLLHPRFATLDRWLCGELGEGASASNFLADLTTLGADLTFESTSHCAMEIFLLARMVVDICTRADYGLVHQVMSNLRPYYEKAELCLSRCNASRVPADALPLLRATLKHWIDTVSAFTNYSQPPSLRSLPS